MRHHIFLLARRDFLQRARSRGFLITMGITVALILAIGPVVSAFAPEPEATTIGVVGTTPDGFGGALEAVADTYEREVELREVDDVSTAEALLEGGEVDVALVDGSELVSRTEPGSVTTAIVQGALDSLARQAAIAELGLDAEEVASLLTPEQLDFRRLQPEDPNEVSRIVAGYVTIFVLYLAILVFGQFVLMGVMEEKSSRVVEVVLSRAKPESVLAGKVLGIGALGLLQVLAVVGAGLVSISFVDTGDIPIPEIGVSAAASAIVWFVLGFGLYAVVYAGLGATITRQEDVQGAAMIPALLILPAYFIALASLETPNSALALFGSFFPATAPIIMPMRTAVTDVPWWEVALSIAIIAVTIVILIRVSARIYRGAALRIGAKVKLRDAWRTAEE